MGNCVAHPKEKKCGRSISSDHGGIFAENKISFGVASLRGWRPTMEVSSFSFQSLQPYLFHFGRVENEIGDQQEVID